MLRELVWRVIWLVSRLDLLLVVVFLEGTQDLLKTSWYSLISWSVVLTLVVSLLYGILALATCLKFSGWISRSPISWLAFAPSSGVNSSLTTTKSTEYFLLFFGFSGFFWFFCFRHIWWAGRLRFPRSLFESELVVLLGSFLRIFLWLSDCASVTQSMKSDSLEVCSYSSLTACILLLRVDWQHLANWFSSPQEVHFTPYAGHCSRPNRCVPPQNLQIRRDGAFLSGNFRSDFRSAFHVCFWFLELADGFVRAGLL